MLTKNNSFKIIRIFFDSPEKKFHIREIARITRLSPPAVMKIAEKLSKEGLLISEKGKVVTDLSASKSEKFIQIKRSFNLYSLYECGLVAFLRNVYEEPEAIVLFGSYSRGEDTSKSDIDIAVITGKRIMPDIKRFERPLCRKISIDEINIKEAEDSFLNSLANGIVLYGYLKVL